MKFFAWIGYLWRMDNFGYNTASANNKRSGFCANSTNFLDSWREIRTYSPLPCHLDCVVGNSLSAM